MIHSSVQDTIASTECSSNEFAEKTQFIRMCDFIGVCVCEILYKYYVLAFRMSVFSLKLLILLSVAEVHVFHTLVLSGKNMYLCEINRKADLT